MLKLLTCSRGHFWEQPDEVNGAACPECGAPPETLPLLDLVPETPVASAPPAVKEVVLELFDGKGRPIIRGYEILEDLGRTYAGVRLYKAKQNLLNRTVLLEVVVAREDSSQRAFNSLRGEASALGKLSHPNIRRIHEAGERDRQLFFNAVEWIDGPTLAQKVADKPLPFRQIIRLMRLLAQAIDQAHRQGMLHRNLKPSSILLEPIDLAKNTPPASDPGGSTCLLHSGWFVPRITDFGHARRPVEGDPTDVDLFGEEVGFLSPEQAWGRARDIDQATDVYGLGAILFFLIARRPPFRGQTISDVLDAILSANNNPLAAVSRAPRDLDAICRKCLRRLPRRRYASAGALAGDLLRAEQGLPLSCVRLSPAERFGKWIRRRPAAAGLILVTFLGLVGSLIAYGIGSSESMANNPAYNAREMDNRLRQAKAAEAISADLLNEFHRRENFLVYLDSLRRAERQLQREQLNLARELLVQCSPEHRGLEWYCLWERARGREPARFKNDAPVADLAFPPGTSPYIAMVSNSERHDRDKKHGMVRLWKIREEREAEVLIDYPATLHSLCFSPIGDKIATAGETVNGDTEIHLWRFAPGPTQVAPLWKRNIPFCGPINIAFIRNDRMISPSAGTGSLCITGDRGGRLGELQTSINSRDGKVSKRLCADTFFEIVAVRSERDRRVYLWDVQRSQLVKTIIVPAEIHDMAMGGHRLAVACADRTVRFYSTNGEDLFQVRSLPQDVRRLTFNPDGSRLAGACKNGTIMIWGAFTNRGCVEMLELSGAAGTSALAISDSGRYLAATAEREVVVWGRSEAED